MEERDALEAGICGACGLCCNGTIFGYVPISHEEKPAADRASLPIFEDKGKLGFTQPCPAHRGDRCSIYAERPAVCARYRCALLERYEGGEVRREEALARIAEARRLAGALRSLLDAGGQESASLQYLWRVMEARTEADGALADTLEWRRRNQALLLEAASVITFLRRHFEADLRKSPASPSGERDSAGQRA